MKRRFFAGVVCFAVSGVFAGAHRLDEYLQAARIGVDADRISLELDLTPGVSVAEQVLDGIDTNRDGALSAAEQQAYARTVVGSLTLDLDGRPASLALETSRFPSRDQIVEGVGSIRLTAAARVSTTAGSHALRFRNANRPDLSVYLANALAPDDARIEILKQTRDPQQRELVIDYRVAGHRGVGAAAAATALTAIALIWTRRRAA